MNATGKNHTSIANPDLQLAFDVGHSSIGWAVFETGKQLEIKGCGSVIFRADDCLASSRRAYRRQRRHIRSTRQRIARMKILLKHLGTLTETELDKPGCAWPWKLAAQILQGGKSLTWPELWDVLRWYAHNRGYDGNQRWSRNVKAENEDLDEAALETILQNSTATDDEKKDAEKVKAAKKFMRDLHTNTMAETFCAICGIDPHGKKKSANLSGDKRPKAQNAAFPRKIVESEVRKILRVHFGKLKEVDEKLERTLLGKDSNDKTAWREISCPELKLPKRYEGGLLFGQLVPRFDNRIISICPISEQKVPSRNCLEFLKFRWAMLLANIKVARPGERDLSPLTVPERKVIDAAMRTAGAMTEGELKKVVRETTKSVRDKLDQMFMEELDAKKALVLDPVQELVNSNQVAPFWKLFSEHFQKRLRGQWRRGKVFSLAHIRKQLESLGGDVGAFDVVLQGQLDAHNSKAKKKEKQITREDFLKKTFPAHPLKLDGRAAFARHLLKQAYEEVLAGKHPKEEGGCLFISEEIRQKQLNREIAEQTNNHLVRHRLLILERLLADIVKEYAENKKERIGKITIEVNRDLREMSGKTAKAKAQDLGLRIANHHAVAKKLEEAFAEEGIKQPITAGLIRKARIAEDLGWRCPYTGQPYEPKDLVTRRVDKDHIVPRSERASDSLDSLVITFSEINKWKGKRTALQFVTEEQGKPVPNLKNYEIMSLTRYKQFVESLESYKGHDDDKRRKKRRKELMLLPKYEEKEFTPRDLTQTSQLARLGAQVLRKQLPHLTTGDVTSLPGSVTGTVRKNWKLEGCLGLANPQVLNENGEAKTKTEIRDITHLHHALDACVLGIAGNYFKNQKLGAASLWELLIKRKYSEQEKSILRALGLFQFDKEGNSQLKELPKEIKEQIRQRLAEKRVVQHIPARMDGLRVEQNTWRVVSVKDGEATIQQRIRQPDGSRPQKPPVKEKVTKLLGIEPVNGKGKLAVNKGALVIPDNYGVALEPQPTIIPFHKVWMRLQELKRANAGKMPRILRNGQLIRVLRGSRAGIWRVLSTKNTVAYGLALDLALPDRVKLDRGNAPIERLIRDGLEILEGGFAGVDSSGVIIAEAKKRPRKPKAAGTDASCSTITSG